MRFRRLFVVALIVSLGGAARADQQKPAPAPAAGPVDVKLQALKRQAMADIDGMKTLTQQMIDQVFSFGELGFQETETSKYLIGVLRQNGFTIQEGRRRDSDGVGRDLGQRQARHRPRVGHRRPPADQPEAGRA